MGEDAEILPDSAVAEPANPPVDAGPPPPALTNLVLAVGLSPRTYDSAGFYDVFERSARLASIGVMQVPIAWDKLRGLDDCPTYTRAYGWLVDPAFANGRSIFDVYGLRKAVWLSFTNPADTSRLNLADGVAQTSFADPALAAAYVSECVWIADFFRPEYLAIGVEIDTYVAAASPTERNALLAAVAEARRSIKVAHPGTTVFVYFQYENVVRLDLWEMIRPFAVESDVLGFSSYPSLPGAGDSIGFTAAALPDDYYASIAAHFGPNRPIVFAELGHPAAPSALFGAGGEGEQVAFIERFFAIAPTSTSVASWTYLYDTDLSRVYGASAAAYFGSMGLLRATSPAGDTASWAAWQAWHLRASSISDAFR